MCYDLSVPAPAGLSSLLRVALVGVHARGFFMQRRSGGWWSAWYTACTFRRVPA